MAKETFPFCSSDLTLKNGAILVSVKKVESLLELLNLIIGELIKASSHTCNCEKLKKG